MRLLFRTVALMGALGSVTAAAACPTLDGDRDNLAPEVQRAALVLLEDGLADAGLDPCDGQWTLSHVQLGSSISVALSDGQQSQRMSVAAVEELPLAYERLIRAIQTGVPVEETADRSSVAAGETAPQRVQADPMAYVQLGGRTQGTDAPGNGAVIGGGYRHSLDRFAVDAAAGYLFPQDVLEDGIVGIFLELSGLYYLDGEAQRSLYFGGGGGLWLMPDGASEEVALEGISVLLSGGYELMRHSSIRFYPQLDVSLPTSAGPDGWSPSLIMTANAGFTPGALRR